MVAGGREFFISANGVWLTDAVPVEYIDFPDGVSRSGGRCGARFARFFRPGVAASVTHGGPNPQE